MARTPAPRPAEYRPPPLVLASQSPRRVELLAQIGVFPDHVTSPRIDELPRVRELPRALAQRLARTKAQVLGGIDSYVLAADTVVAVGRRPLPEPTDPDIARKCLAMISGRKHRVFTAVCLRLLDGTIVERVSESAVTFARLTGDQLDRYILTDEWRGKAGAYAIQGIAASFVRGFSGSHSGVMGLPLFETAQLLRGHGWRIP